MSLLGIAIAILALLFLSFRLPDSSLGTEFPINLARVVDFEYDEETFIRLTAREQVNQLRDWLLFTIVSSSDLSVGEVNQILYDLPTIRHGYTKPVGRFEYGRTRSAYLGNGRVIALLPSVTSNERANLLSKIADYHRMSLEKIPETFFIFEYEIDLQTQIAKVTQKQAITGHDLFVKAFGYHESEIEGLANLEKFMTQVDDLTYAQIDNNRLVLGGRKLSGVDYRNIRVEDVAAIWQAEKKITESLDRFEKKWKEKDKKFKENKTYKIYREIKRLSEESDEEFLRRREESEKEYKNLFQKLEKERNRRREAKKKEWKENKLVLGSGFSLDWRYDYEGLLNAFNALKPYFHELAGLRPPVISQEDIDKVEYSLTVEDETLFLALADSLSERSERRASMVGTSMKVAAEKFCFQIARYDGDLQGTEVGMVLFYTDLLSKIWAINYVNATADANIADFIPETQIPISPIYEEDAEKYNSTRTWFGPHENGFQVQENSKKLFFARKAIRVYSASSNTYEPGIEVAPNAYSAAFTDWWNNYYDEVARYEPEYERLNEIMKWSLLVSWLADDTPSVNGKRRFLGFIKNVPINRSNWFPEWVRNNPQLKFTQWDSVICLQDASCAVRFYERGYKGTTSETMPLLYSSFGKRVEELRMLYGGVNLGGKSAIQLSKNLPKANVDKWGKIVNRNIYHYSKNTQFNIKTLSGNRASVKSIAMNVGKGRGKFSELANLRFERVIARDPAGISFRTQIGRTNLGDLKILRRGNGFKVGWQSRNIDAGQSLARRISTNRNPAKFLADNPKVELALELPGRQQYLIKLEGENRWMKMAVGKQPKKWQSETIVAEINGGKKIELSWIDDAAAKHEIAATNYVIEPVKGAKSVAWKTGASPRGPPFEIQFGNTAIKGRLNTQTGKIQLSGEEVSKLSRTELGRLQKTLRQEDLVKIRNLAGNKTVPIRYEIPGARLRTERLTRNLKGKNYDEVAQNIVRDPQAYKNLISKQLEAELRMINRQLAEQNYRQAIRNLDGMINKYGNLPEFTIRKGIAEISKGSIPNATRALNSSAKLSMRNRATFFDEINSRLKPSTLTKAERANLQTTARLADWRDLQVRGLVPGGQVSVVAKGPQLRLNYRMAKIPKTRLVKAREIGMIDPKKSSVYIQDTPGLNNLDWSTSINSSMEQVISGRIGSIHKLTRTHIAHFRPAKIYAPDGVTQYRAVTKIDAIPKPFYLPYAIGTAAVGGDDEEDRYVYIVTASVDMGTKN
jgi:hypothetical protein